MKIRIDFTPDLSQYAFIVLFSPIYRKEVRKPIIQFVKDNNFEGIEIFILFTGNHRNKVEKELSLFMPYLEETGAIHIGHFKYSKRNPEYSEKELIQCTMELALSQQ